MVDFTPYVVHDEGMTELYRAEDHIEQFYGWEYRLLAKLKVLQKHGLANPQDIVMVQGFLRKIERLQEMIKEVIESAPPIARIAEKYDSSWDQLVSQVDRDTLAQEEDDFCK